MKLSAITVILAMVGTACGTIEDGAVDIGTGDESGKTAEKAGGGLGSDNPQSETDAPAGEHAGTYVLSNGTANDGYNMYYYSVVGGTCGMELLPLAELKYTVNEDNDCTLRDQYGDVFEWSDAAQWVAVLDKFGALVDVEDVETSGGSGSTENNVSAFKMRFTSNRAIFEVTKQVGGYDVEYTYEYTKM